MGLVPGSGETDELVGQMPKSKPQEQVEWLQGAGGTDGLAGQTDRGTIRAEIEVSEGRVWSQELGGADELVGQTDGWTDKPRKKGLRALVNVLHNNSCIICSFSGGGSWRYVSFPNPRQPIKHYDEVL